MLQVVSLPQSLPVSLSYSNCLYCNINVLKELCGNSEDANSLMKDGVLVETFGKPFRMKVINLENGKIAISSFIRKYLNVELDSFISIKRISLRLDPQLIIDSLTLSVKVFGRQINNNGPFEIDCKKLSESVVDLFDYQVGFFKLLCFSILILFRFCVKIWLYLIHGTRKL